MTEHCCPACKGSPPWFICRKGRCICHLAADWDAANTTNRLAHADKTADTAIGNITRNEKSRP